MTKPSKVEDLMEEVSNHVNNGTYVYSHHALERQGQRNVIDPEVEHVLLTGWWDKQNDRRSAEHGDEWTYAIRGRTIDQRRLKIIVAFDEEEPPWLVVVTVIDLDGESEV